MTIRYAAPFQTAFDDSGLIIAGAKLDTFEADTVNTPLATYSDPELTTPHTNPVIADANGRFPDIYLLAAKYKFVLKDANDNVIRESDNYDNESLVRLDVDNVFTGDITMSGAAINEAQAADIPSANTIDLGNIDGNFVNVTGTTTVTSLGTAPAGAERVVRFLDSLTLTHNVTSLILPGANNIITEANDVAKFRSLGGGNWICSSYERSNGGVIDLVTKNEGELTIASGEITATSSRHTVDTEADAASDDLDTINGGVDGKYLLINIEDDTRDVVLKHNTGNLFLSGAADRTLDVTTDIALFQYNSTESKWIEITNFASSGGGGNLLTTEVFTSSGTFNVPANVTEVEVECWGGGGNGGSDSTSIDDAGGGGGGGYVFEKVTGLTPLGTVSVTVATAGGTSSFGAFCSATGGSNGSGTGGGGGAGIGVGGELNFRGGAGGVGGSESGENHVHGLGGNAPRGGGGGSAVPANSTGSGGPGGFPGGGGGGGNSGGAGANGLVVVRY